MKILALTIAASLGGSLAMAGPAATEMPARGDTFVLEMAGQQGWEVSCELTQNDGDRIAARDRGTGEHRHGRFAVSDVTGGLCAYSVPARGELRLTLNIEQTGFQCPFLTSADGMCAAYLQPGGRGSFPIRLSGERAGAGS